MLLQAAGLQVGGVGTLVSELVRGGWDATVWSRSGTATLITKRATKRIHTEDPTPRSQHFEKEVNEWL